jgi:hypothetical protein
LAPVAAVAVVVVVAEPVSVSAVVVAVAAVVVAVVAVVAVLALRSSDKPTPRKVERCRLQQVPQSICRGLDWCRLRLPPRFHRS